MKIRNNPKSFDTSKVNLRVCTHQRKPVKAKYESFSPLLSSYTSNNSHQGLKSLIFMSETEEILELEQLQLKQIQLENKFLSKIPIFKSPLESDVTEFLNQADDIFNKLKYSDDLRIVKIEDKLDSSLQQWFTSFKKYGDFTWNNFKNELPNCLQLKSSVSSNTTNNNKFHEIPVYDQNSSNENPSLLDSLRQDLISFSSNENALQWFLQIDKKFSELQLSFQDRIDILPYFFKGEAIIWYSLNKNKFQCYTDFCQLFALEYLQKDHSINHYNLVEQKNNSSTLHSPVAINDHLLNHPIESSHVKITSTDCHSISSSNSNNAVLTTSILSPTISKALIDRFVKDPIKFYGGKDNVITWLDEIDQQFKMMNLSDSDKLNLIHICLKSEAHQWYKQYKEQFISWTIFVTEITKSFTSNLQRDLAFKKLKQYHQTIHQSVTQYYVEMIKLMKQTDPQMNESTKIQYLMNGLRPSLSTETRRNYPKSTQEFLEQAKIAEELTALNTTNTSDSLHIDDLTQHTSLLYSNSSNLTPTNNSNNYSRNSKNDNRYYTNTNSSHTNNNNRPRYLNRIYNQSSYNSYERNDHSHLPHQENNSEASQNSPSSSITYNNNQKNSYQQHQQTSFQRCFKCGSLAHQARHCDRFENRSQ
jgi:hypothetical protein